MPGVGGATPISTPSSAAISFGWPSKPGAGKSVRHRVPDEGSCLSECPNPFDAEFAADAGLAAAAERQARILRGHAVAVDADRTRHQLPRDPLGERVVTGLAPDTALATKEQFGPVLPIFGYESIEEAVTAANATEFGLTASVWTGDDALADRIAGQLVAGTVSVNCHGMAAQDPRLPFGGCGQSGLGRELGVDGIRAFTQARTFVRHPVPG